MSLLKVTNVLECPIKSDHYISEKRNSPTVVVEYFFVDYAIIRFCVFL